MRRFEGWDFSLKSKLGYRGGGKAADLIPQFAVQTAAAPTFEALTPIALSAVIAGRYSLRI